MIAIGSLSLTSPLLLAPLAGYSDLPFRLVCREYGAGLCVSEMISCHGLVYRQARTLAMLRSCAEDRPVSFQLFGAEPAIMGEAAARLSAFSPDLIDINMGCPVKKVTRRGAGAALMTDLPLAERIVTRVVADSACPVTVKIRSGPDRSSINAVEFARMAEACGAAAVTVHGRVWSQFFSGSADWDIVRQVKQSVSIPVIGNGDIDSHETALQRRAATGCDGVMIGRAALGNPWVFHRLGRPQDLASIARGAFYHCTLVERCYEQPARRLAAVRNQLGRYFKGLPGSAAVRQRIYAAKDWQALMELLSSLSSSQVTSESTADSPAPSSYR